MQHLRRIACLFLLGLAAAPAASGATVRLGQTAPSGTAADCVNCSVFQLASGATSPSYVIPSGGGTITSWSTQGAPSSLSCLITGCSARLQVFRPASTAGQYSFVAQSGQKTIPAATLSTFTTSIPVRAGDIVGLLGTQVPLESAGTGSDLVGIVTGLPVVGSLIGSGLGALPISTGGGLINVSVTLDPTVGGTSGSGGSSGGSTQSGDSTSAAGPFAGVALAARVVRVSRSGVARIVVRCPADAASSCAGRLTLKNGRIGLGHTSFRVPSGTGGKVNLRVSKKGRKLLRGHRRLAALASASARDGRGQRKLTRAALTLVRR